MPTPLSPAEAPELMTALEAAEYLRIPQPTIYYLLQRGQLPGVQIGGRWRIKRSQLDHDVLKNEEPVLRTVTLAIQNASSMALADKSLRGLPVQINKEPTILQNSENQTIVTDGDLGEQFGQQISSFRGQVITLVTDKTDANMAANLNHFNPVTFVFTEDLGNPDKDLRAALNLPR
jgi:excisionase family DNA binding protein